MIDIIFQKEVGFIFGDVLGIILVDDISFIFGNIFYCLNGDGYVVKNISFGVVNGDELVG